jgi:uncharacterized protein (DUF1697 family)
MSASKTSALAAYVALLRGINVGGKNMLPMQELAAIFAAAGAVNVATYIQSGNVIFQATDSAAKILPAKVSSEVEKRFGFAIPVVLRSASDLRAILGRNPFLRIGAPEETLHVMFLAGTPSARAVASLDPARSPGDTFAVCGSEVYLQLPNGTARSKLTNAYFDAKLATVSTIRNWRTAQRLTQMASACGA